MRMTIVEAGPSVESKTIEVEMMGSSARRILSFSCTLHRPDAHQEKYSVRSLTHFNAVKLRDFLNEAYPAPQTLPMQPMQQGVQETPSRARPHGPQEYKGNGKHSWENVGGTTVMQRLRVPGGWLYRQRGYSVTTFVPMPETVGYGV